MSQHGNSRNHEKSALAKQVAELRRRCETTARFQGGNTCYGEEMDIFIRFCQEHKLFLSSQPSTTINRPPDDEGNEHQVWYDSNTDNFIKITWPNHFGMRVVYRSDEEPSSSPIDYLERWHLHNIIFGDSIVFIGVLKTDEGLRLVIEQEAIHGSPASQTEIQEFFESTGWQKFRIGMNIAFYDKERDLVISDTHEGNIIRVTDGLLLPIDLRVQKLSPTLVDAVKQLI